MQRYFEISLLLTLATGFITLTMTGKLDTLSIVVVSSRPGREALELLSRGRLFPLAAHGHADFHLLHLLLRPRLLDLRARA